MQNPTIPIMPLNSVSHWTLMVDEMFLFNYHKIRLTCNLPPGGDDGPTLSRLPLRPHRVLGLPPAVRLPSGRIRGRPPPSSRRCCPIFTPQNQGGAERRRSQEEGQESRVRRRAAPAKLHLTRPHRGLHMVGLPIPF